MLWLLRSSPLNMRALMWTKYWVGLTPLLVLALGLTIGTNIILKVDTFMMVLSIVTITVMSFAIGSIALGFGALFPRFDNDNAAEISTGFGGLLFMMVATGYLVAVVVAEAWPVYAFLHARAEGTAIDRPTMVFLVLGFAIAAALSAAAIILPFRAGVRRITEIEI